MHHASVICLTTFVLTTHSYHGRMMAHHLPSQGGLESCRRENIGRIPRIFFILFVQIVSALEYQGVIFEISLLSGLIVWLLQRNLHKAAHIHRTEKKIFQKVGVRLMTFVRVKRHSAETLQVGGGGQSGWQSWFQAPGNRGKKHLLRCFFPDISRKISTKPPK